ncbi:hypothetical protein GA0115233_12153, partial [Streptomyces sp. DI166]|uniref:hypothetical protein n=2 Tax=unclassified Streptomyces TaxID=2593676 RepID=UPI0007F36517
RMRMRARAVGRWAVAVVGSVMAFFAVAVPWAVVSEGGDDPWDVIGPVAGVVAAGVLAALGFWSAQGAGATGARRVTTLHVRQSARGRGGIKQTGRDHGAGARSRRPEHMDVRQRARGDGTGDIDQVGDSRY